MPIPLSPPSIATVKAVVNFSRLFNADLVKITSTTAAAIDDIPSLFVLFEGTSYDGPDLLLTRLRDLSQRLSFDQGSVTIVTGGVEDKPKALLIKSGKSTIDFRLASASSSDRIPSKFSGAFVHELECLVDDIQTAVSSAASIGSKTLTFIGDGAALQLSATSEGETYKMELEDVPTTVKFQYNYSVEFLSAVLKLLPKGSKHVTFNTTAKGHMRVQLPTTSAQITASVFLLDIKNR